MGEKQPINVSLSYLTSLFLYLPLINKYILSEDLKKCHVKWIDLETQSNASGQAVKTQPETE